MYLSNIDPNNHTECIGVVAFSFQPRRMRRRATENDYVLSGLCRFSHNPAIMLYQLCIFSLSDTKTFCFFFFADTMLEPSEENLADFRLAGSPYGTNHQDTDHNVRTARWIMPGETVTIGNYQITGGYIYVGKGLKSLSGLYPDAALIDPELNIDDRMPDYVGHHMDYWPQYSRIHPESRAAYLHWLSGDRSDPHTFIGFVFLYFYGIERRLLRDAAKGLVCRQERSELIDELHRLKDVYRKNYSFSRYVTRLLSHVWAIDQQTDHTRPRPEYLHEEYLFLCGLKRALAEAADQGRPIDKKIALAWLKSYPHLSLDALTRRHPDAFEHLFMVRYQQQYGEGMVIKPNQKKLRLQYRPASISLKGYPGIICGLPDVSLERAPVKALEDISHRCIKELGPYCRYLKRSYDSPDSLIAFSKLPADLAGILPHVRFDRLKAWLKETVTRQVQPVSAKILCGHFGYETPDELNKKNSLMLTDILERAGFGMAPDMRFHDARPDTDGAIVLFPGGHGSDFSPSQTFCYVRALVRLATMFIANGSDTLDNDGGILKQIITDNSDLTRTEKLSLQAYMVWRLQAKPSTIGLKAALSKLSDDQKTRAAHLLVRIVPTAGDIGPGQIRQLEKLYTMLGLDKALVAADIHAQSVRRGTSESGKANIEDGKSIMDANRNRRNERRGLDRALLDMHEKETEDVQDVLHAIFGDEKPAVTSVPVPAESSEQADRQKPLTGLDSNHRQLYQTLITREEWPMDEIRQLCSRLGLMAEGALETINDWAFDILDAPLIENGSTVFVDLELVGEIEAGG